MFLSLFFMLAHSNVMNCNEFYKGWVNPIERAHARDFTYETRSSYSCSGQFRKCYQRGDLPLAIDHNQTRLCINWKVELAKMDYHYYLPLFFDGVREKEDPYRFLAVKGIEDLLKVSFFSISLRSLICQPPWQNVLEKFQGWCNALHVMIPCSCFLCRLGKERSCQLYLNWLFQLKTHSIHEIRKSWVSRSRLVFNSFNESLHDCTC